ncbi:MAG: HD domain-containing protein [Anaeroplasmataceae bacterium]|nr:HD domain-containing protein [Anaeroplasmataceae bacterium]HRF70064.1 HD domain-containing protein [Candidatus Pelethenecus sp.]
MKIIGKILGINTSDNMINLLIVDKDAIQWNIKTEAVEQFTVGYVYVFEVQQIVGERVSYQLINYTSLNSLPMEQADEILRSFYPQAPVSLKEAQSIVYQVIADMKNQVVQDITKSLIDKFSFPYFLYPAATKMHHTYVGGLAYHSIGMLKLAKAFIDNYPYLNKDYLYAGILLHDLGKTRELSGVQASEYTLDGQLLGHLVIGALEISKMAERLGYSEAKEVKALEHMLISHHGQPQFGAAKRPMTPEAVALWYIDTVDSKFRVLGEELEKTKSSHFTDTIGVLDKIKIYKE